ncbi:M23 family metallopeptidase [Sphingomonas sinipercae]|uniref:M23 family metallopeptidase n=1 Tax=Sphingomonas sinipercae TaxID=2714944 RepID=A0A6G7ZKX8_9SPHN|nr:M23 family metallopeptidase [Sphingomonas sinipercae]QIL01631.1 M23 family metallopeptidase [Sphingomonas sinipercae]
MLSVARLINWKAGRDSAPFSFVVDLAHEPIGGRWFRGAATLALLCGAAIALSPGLPNFATGAPEPMPSGRQFQMNAMLSATGDIPVLPSRPVAAPPRRPDEIVKPTVAAQGDMIRVQGAVTEGLYWSLRDAGVSSEMAADYLRALSSRIDVGTEVAPYDRFDLVMSRAPGGGLLFAALHRFQGDDVQLVKWNANGRVDWFDGDAGARRSDGLMAPVAGRITSSFGMRRHPILGFARMHSGIDFGAKWGSPIAAAADGRVIGAGWAGGYGRQVQVLHEGGYVSSYSHMSGFAAEPGQAVRQGQVIGYVGSTGLSTGPHLHFEVKMGGRAVNPMAVRLRSAGAISGPALQALKARLKQLTSIGAPA